MLPQINTMIFETIGIKVKTNNNTKIKILSTYLPGGTSNQLINQHYANEICNSYFIFGDFNSKHRLWICSRANLPTPTHTPNENNKIASTIDIMITPLSSYHNAVVKNIELIDGLATKQKHLSLSFKDADWPKFRGIVHYHINENSLNVNNITSTTQIDAHIDKFEHLLKHAQQRTIPSKQMNKYSLKLTDTILRCIHTK